MRRRYEFVQLDVFTRTRLMGNPLAVVTDARGLTDDEMQKLAREMNLSETTFIVPRAPEVEAREGHRVRIFTIEEELAFAGHRHWALRCIYIARWRAKQIMLYSI